MRIFLSYPSEFFIAAEEVVLALRGAGHAVFFDRDHLEPGGDGSGSHSEQSQVSQRAPSTTGGNPVSQAREISNEPLEWDFFLAYASADRSRAESLYAALSTNHRVFLDAHEVRPGDDWPRSISRALSATRLTIILISANSGEAHYLRDEISTAIYLARKDAKRRRVIPVFLDGFPSNVTAVPYGLGPIQGLDARKLGMEGIAVELRKAAVRQGAESELQHSQVNQVVTSTAGGDAVSQTYETSRPAQDENHTRGDYNGVIQQELSKSDLFIFFAVAESLSVGSYTLTELELAKDRWPNPEGRVLTVTLNGMDVSTLPPYLRAVTVLRPQGNVAAEVRNAVERLAKSHQRRALRRVAIGFGLGMVMLAGLGTSLRLPPGSGEKAALPNQALSAEEGLLLEPQEVKATKVPMSGNIRAVASTCETADVSDPLVSDPPVDPFAQSTGSNSPADTSTHKRGLVQAAATTTPAATPTQKSASPETSTAKVLTPSMHQRTAHSADRQREVNELIKERDAKCQFSPALGTRSAINTCLSDYNAMIEFLLRQKEN